MTKKLHNVTTSMVEGIAISITSTREDSKARFERYEEIQESVKKCKGVIVDEEKTIDAIKLIVSFPNRRKQRKWLKMEEQF